MSKKSQTNIESAPTGSSPLAGSGGLAHALALNYYQGQYRERYYVERNRIRKDGMLTSRAQTVRENVEVEAAKMADQFWREWLPDAETLLPNH